MLDWSTRCVFFVLFLLTQSQLVDTGLSPLTQTHTNTHTSSDYVAMTHAVSQRVQYVMQPAINLWTPKVSHDGLTKGGLNAPLIHTETHRHSESPPLFSDNAWITSRQLCRSTALSLWINISHPQGLGAALPQAVMSRETCLSRDIQHSFHCFFSFFCVFLFSYYHIWVDCLRMDGWMLHLVVIETFGGSQLYPELCADPKDRQHNTNNGHKECQLDLKIGEHVNKMFIQSWLKWWIQA